MPRITCLSLLLFLLPVCTFGQQNKVMLNGYLAVATGESFPYRLEFTGHNGKVEGFSYTYSEPNETKSSISGMLDRQKRTLTFKETGIVYSSGYHTKAYMCLVHANLEYVQSDNGLILTGALSTKEADNTLCTGGTLTFSNKSELEHLFSYQEHYDEVVVMRPKARQNEGAEEHRPVHEPVEHAEDKLTTGMDRTIDWHSDSVVVELWDGGHLDGDRVTLLADGKSLLNDYCLMKTKRLMKIALPSNGLLRLEVIAGNEGSEPPNTASLRLSDGAIHYNILAYNKKGDKVEIRIRKVTANK